MSWCSGSANLEPPLAAQHVVSQRELVGRETFLAIVPGVGGADNLVSGRGTFVTDDPMHGREQLEPEGSLEAVDQIGNGVEALLGVVGGGQHRLGVGDRAGHDLKLLVGRITTIGVTRDEMAFDGPQKMGQILGIGAVMRLAVLEAQPLAGFLEKVEELVDP
jgi:hypothetical protein